MHHTSHNAFEMAAGGDDFIYTDEELHKLQMDLIERLYAFDFAGVLRDYEEKNGIMNSIGKLRKDDKKSLKNINIKKTDIANSIRRYKIVDFDFRKAFDIEFCRPCSLFTMTYINIYGDCYGSCFSLDHDSLKNMFDKNNDITWNNILFVFPFTKRDFILREGRKPYFYEAFVPYSAPDETRKNLEFKIISEIKTRDDFVGRVNKTVEKYFDRKRGPVTEKIIYVPGRCVLTNIQDAYEMELVELSKTYSLLKRLESLERLRQENIELKERLEILERKVARITEI